MTEELNLEMQAIRDQMISRQLLNDFKQAKRNRLAIYAEVSPAAVPAAKRKAAADILEKLAAVYVAHRPKITWYEPLCDEEQALLASGSYPVRHFLDEKGMNGFCIKERHEIGLSVELDLDELEFVLRHEFAHAIGIANEDDADKFAHQEAA